MSGASTEPMRKQLLKSKSTWSVPWMEVDAWRSTLASMIFALICVGHSASCITVFVRWGLRKSKTCNTSSMHHRCPTHSSLSWTRSCKLASNVWGAAPSTQAGVHKAWTIWQNSWWGWCLASPQNIWVWQSSWWNTVREHANFVFWILHRSGIWRQTRWQRRTKWPGVAPRSFLGQCDLRSEICFCSWGFPTYFLSLQSFWDMALSCLSFVTLLPFYFATLLLCGSEALRLCFFVTLLLRGYMTPM